MKIPLKWLSDYVPLDLPVAETQREQKIAHHDLARLDAQVREVARIEPDAGELMSFLAQPFTDAHRRADTFQRVVGVDDKDAVVRHGGGVGLEGFLLGVERHDPAVRMRPLDRDSIPHSRQDIRTGRTAADVRRTARRHRAVDSLRATKAEVRAYRMAVAHHQRRVAEHGGVEPLQHMRAAVVVDRVGVIDQAIAERLDAHHRAEAPGCAHRSACAGVEHAAHGALMSA